MTDQKVFIISTFYSSGVSCVAVQTDHHRDLCVRVAPSRGTTKQILNSLKKGEVSVINVRRDLNVARLFERNKSVPRGRR
jgi:hypothetical protein